MSIILDALKKAETERHLGQLPSLHSPSSAATRSGVAGTHRISSAVWFSSVAAALLIAVGVGWFYWSESLPAQRAHVVQQKLALERPAEPVIVVMPDREIPVPPPLPLPIPVAVIKPALIAPAKATQSVPPPSDKPAITATTVTTTASQERIVALADLAPALQRELPALVIGGSMYSDNAADRMLLVDRRLLHEGDEAGSGVVLEKIMPKEAILRYRGARFRINF